MKKARASQQGDRRPTNCDRTRGMPLYQPACSSVACLPDTGAEPLAPSAARDAPYLPHAPSLSPRWSCPQMRVVPDVSTLSPRDSASSILRCRPRRATFRLTLWELTLRRSAGHWRGVREASPPRRRHDRKREAATPLCRLPQAANSRRLWPSMFYPDSPAVRRLLYDFYRDDYRLFATHGMLLVE